MITSIFLSPKEKEVIDEYCRVNGISKSNLLVQGALNIINGESTLRKRIGGDANATKNNVGEIKHFCEHCRREAVGKYMVRVFYDVSGDNNDVIKKLCYTHLIRAQREGAEVKLIEDYQKETEVKDI